jgi:ATPase subunit of ABC transporter with duplicated ATPase domains
LLEQYEGTIVLVSHHGAFLRSGREAPGMRQNVA